MKDYGRYYSLILLIGNGYPKYGGVGGQGGCVAFEASENVTMKMIAKKYVIYVNFQTQFKIST